MLNLIVLIGVLTSTSDEFLTKMQAMQFPDLRDAVVSAYQECGDHQKRCKEKRTLSEMLKTISDTDGNICYQCQYHRQQANTFFYYALLAEVDADDFVKDGMNVAVEGSEQANYQPAKAKCDEAQSFFGAAGQMYDVAASNYQEALYHYGVSINCVDPPQ